MLSISIDHPDSEEFITKKQDLTKVTGANISVKVSDEFMNAVENDADYFLRYPVDAKIDFSEYESANYNELVRISEDEHIYIKKIKAKVLWTTLMKCAWSTAEPGILFETTMHEYSPDGVYKLLRMISTNPCQPAWATILTPNGISTIGEIQIGDKIWSSEGWTTVVSKWSTGVKEVYEYRTISGSFIGTENHRVVSEGKKVEAKNAQFIDYLDTEMDETGTVITTPEKILKVIYRSTEEVFDLTVDNSSHTYWTGGVNVSNCGEIGMGPFDSCRLLHSNLVSVIKNPFTSSAMLDKDLLYEISYVAMRLVDGLVDLEIEAVDRIINSVKSLEDRTEYDLWWKIKTAAIQGRRAGLGFTGLADAIASLGLKYDSDEGLAMVDEIMKTIFTAQLDSTIDLAIERGHFPAWDPQLEYSEDKIGNNRWFRWLMDEFPEQANKMIKVGRRNLSFSTVAPTGSVSIMTQTSSGVEPVFMAYYERRKKCMNSDDRVDFTDKLGVNFSIYTVVHHKFKEWAINEYKEENVNEWDTERWKLAFEKSPYFGSTAPEINWRQRVKLQGIIQKYITHSISSTVNLAKETTLEEIAEIYTEAWKLGNKGQTIYRNGCRDGILVSTEEKKETKNCQQLTHHAPKRPKSMECEIKRFRNGGEKWIGAVGLLNGKPYEIFTGLADNLNLPDYVTEGKIVKVSTTVEELNSETGVLEKKKKSRYDIHFSNEEGNLQIVEGLSTVFKPEYYNYSKFISGLLRHGMPPIYVISTIKSLDMGK